MAAKLTKEEPRRPFPSFNEFVEIVRWLEMRDKRQRRKDKSWRERGKG